MKLQAQIGLFLVVVSMTFIGLWAVKSMLFAPKPTEPTITASTIITDLQELQRLETAVFTMEQVIEADANENQAIWQEILFEDKILLIARGQVIAGSDFSKLEDGSIQLNDSSVEVTLPAPEIFTASLDETNTRVYDRATGLLTKGDIDLESQAREIAVDLLEEAACQEGILTQANESAQQQLEVLIKQFGFESVAVTTTEGSCAE